MSANISELKLKLKPCPFCGRKAKTYCTPELECRDGEKVIGVLSKVFSVFCVCTQADVQAETAEKAAEKWNRRAPEWFSVDKVLPADCRACLIATAEGWAVAGYYGNGAWVLDYDELNIECEVTRWQPVPEAPKEDEEDE